MGRGGECPLGGGGSQMQSSLARPPPQGMANTAKKNFGGGNTAWEEKTLSKYEFRLAPKHHQGCWRALS